MADIVRLAVTALVCLWVFFFSGDLWAMGFLLLFLGAVPFGIRAVWKLAKGRKQSALISAIQCAMLLGTAIAMMVLDAANTSLTEKNAQIIVSAVERYKADRKDFPDALNDLVPAYLKEVPSYWRGWQSLPYSYRKRPPSLAYVAGFKIIRIYEFESRTWKEED
jgi:hypothetical protein